MDTSSVTCTLHCLLHFIHNLTSCVYSILEQCYLLLSDHCSHINIIHLIIAYDLNLVYLVP